MATLWAVPYTAYPQGYRPHPMEATDPRYFNYHPNGHLIWRPFPSTYVPTPTQHYVEKRQILGPGLSGPPRKPKQSGYALWVGNLSPGSSLGALKDHFATGARDDILSVSVMSRTGCCFVNYRSERACKAALLRFDRTLLAGHRLNCRLRIAPGDQSATKGTDHQADIDQSGQESDESVVNIHIVDGSGSGSELLSASSTSSGVSSEPRERVPHRFFVMKSLTTKDIEESVRNSTWSTQSHNEAKLNKAYDTADNVILIFSANRSGEFFGYARMESPIVLKENGTRGLSPHSDTIASPATATAPRGRILDDPSRGTLFWEVDSSSEDQDQGVKQRRGENRESMGCERSCTLRWLSLGKVPFHLTRGLRNSWNSGQEVKIARDGTELETQAGRRLLQLFDGVALHSPPPNFSTGFAPVRPSMTV